MRAKPRSASILYCYCTIDVASVEYLFIPSPPTDLGFCSARTTASSMLGNHGCTKQGLAPVGVRSNRAD